MLPRSRRWLWVTTTCWWFTGNRPDIYMWLTPTFKKFFNKYMNWSSSVLVTYNHQRMVHTHVQCDLQQHLRRKAFYRPMHWFWFFSIQNMLVTYNNQMMPSVTILPHSSGWPVSIHISTQVSMIKHDLRLLWRQVVFLNQSNVKTSR